MNLQDKSKSEAMKNENNRIYNERSTVLFVQSLCACAAIRGLADNRKYETASGSDGKANNLFLLGPRRDSQSRKHKCFRKCVSRSSQRPLSKFRHPILFYTDRPPGHSRTTRFQKHWKTYRCSRFRLARKRCDLGLGSNLFFSDSSR